MKKTCFVWILYVLLLSFTCATAEGSSTDMTMYLGDYTLSLPSTWISIDTGGNADETGLMYMGTDADSTMMLQVAKVTDTKQTLASLRESIQSFEGIQNIADFLKNNMTGFSYETSNFVCYVLSPDNSSLFTMNFTSNTGDMSKEFLLNAQKIAETFQKKAPTES